MPTYTPPAPQPHLLPSTALTHTHHTQPEEDRLTVYS